MRARATRTSRAATTPGTHPAVVDARGCRGPWSLVKQGGRSQLDAVPLAPGRSLPEVVAGEKVGRVVLLSRLRVPCTARRLKGGPRCQGVCPFSADWSPLTPTGVVTDGLRWWITLWSCRSYVCAAQGSPKKGRQFASPAMRDMLNMSLTMTISRRCVKSFVWFGRRFPTVHH